MSRLKWLILLPMKVLQPCAALLAIAGISNAFQSFALSVPILAGGFTTARASANDVHPTTTTDNAIARYNGTAGLLQDSAVTIDDTTGQITITGTGALRFVDANVTVGETGTNNMRLSAAGGGVGIWEFYDVGRDVVIARVNSGSSAQFEAGALRIGNFGGTDRVIATNDGGDIIFSDGTNTLGWFVDGGTTGSFRANGGSFQLTDANVRIAESGTNDLDFVADNAVQATVSTIGIAFAVDARTIAATGDANPATLTLAPDSNYVSITCNDAETCDITMSETGAVDGHSVTITNVTTNLVDFADTAGVSELAGAFIMGQYDTLMLTYATDRWVEVGRSDN